MRLIKCKYQRSQNGRCSQKKKKIETFLGIKQNINGFLDCNKQG